MKEPELAARIQLEFGARPDVRLWRNATFTGHVGKVIARGKDTMVYVPRGAVVLAGARVVKGGLCEGSSDLIGIGPGGRFLGPELKTSGTSTSQLQKNWLRVIRELGGVSGIVRSVEDMEKLLEECC